MSSSNSTRAAELAAAQVESIVAAAQVAAEQIKQEAALELANLRPQAEHDAEAIREAARQQAANELEGARKQALSLGQDARKEAMSVLAEAQADAAKVREQTRLAVQGGVAGAQKAAAEVLEEARVLSAGLRQLGEMLNEQGERILRDVHTAHRRMQAHLRAGPADDPADRLTAGPGGRLAGRGEAERASRFRRGGQSSASERRARRDDLDVPAWVVRSG